MEIQLTVLLARLPEPVRLVSSMPASPTALPLPVTDSDVMSRLSTPLPRMPSSSPFCTFM